MPCLLSQISVGRIRVPHFLIGQVQNRPRRGLTEASRQCDKETLSKNHRHVSLFCLSTVCIKKGMQVKYNSETSVKLKDRRTYSV